MSNDENQGQEAADATGLAALNTLTSEDFVDLMLETCHLPVPSWAESLEASRPFHNMNSLVATARSLVAQLTSADLVEAHIGLTPLGERRQPTSDRQARWSRIESAGIPQDSAILERFAQANREYQEKFGHVFLISAAGLHAEEMLASMHRRIKHDGPTEDKAIRDELAKLVQLRLERLVSEMNESATGG